MNINLTLNDYGLKMQLQPMHNWMNYTLKTNFNTKDGYYLVFFIYDGFTKSRMFVQQLKENDIIDEQEFIYPTNIFVKYIKDFLLEHIKKFLLKHISQWNEESAFCGKDIVINFYNEVMNFTLKGYKNENSKCNYR